ncbi:hypothetical protein F5Y08DRAFT_300639 [Xylaria arbuscula]|nr:hypothetical protein F5Y08DRAFT_300639 [Xylaria arbuscula]
MTDTQRILDSIRQSIEPSTSRRERSRLPRPPGKRTRFYKVERKNILSLRENSLNAVIGSCIPLWCYPLYWCWIHLRALDVQSLTDAEVKALDQPRYAVIPKLSPFQTADHIESMTRRTWRYMLLSTHLTGVEAMDSMLAFPLLPNLEAQLQFENEHGARPFSRFNSNMMSIAVGQQEYQIAEIHSFNIGVDIGLRSLHYFDAHSVDEFALGAWHHQTVPSPRYQPSVVALMISIAQKYGTPGEDPVVTRLLMTHRKDNQYIHVYTALVSQVLLERFRNPNQPTRCISDTRMKSSDSQDTGETSPPLIKLHHQCVTFVPWKTFAARLLATMSIYAITMDQVEYRSCFPAPSSFV